MFETTPIKPIRYACPKCKHPLCLSDNAFRCEECNRTYPIVNAIPDFFSGDSGEVPAPVFRNKSKFAKFFNERSTAHSFSLLAPLYESRLWERFFLNLVGAGNTSFRSIEHFHSKTLENIRGNILDVACGPATYGRRIASPFRNVYGIDISLGMLRQGMAYITHDGVHGIHLARARVEELPFENAVFDGVICSGSLHLFPDTVRALREIARTMKEEVPLSVQTFITKSTSGRDGVFAYNLVELQQYLKEAGFEGFQYTLDGTSITFSIRKAISKV